MIRPIGSLRGTIAGAWNLDFSKTRPANIRHLIRQRMTCRPKGKGNKAWSRVEAMYRDPAYLVWPDYALS